MNLRKSRKTAKRLSAVLFTLAAVLSLAAPCVALDIAPADRLTIREGCEYDADGKPTGITAERVILDSSHIAQCSVQTMQDAAGQAIPAVVLRFDEEGSELFAEATERLSGSQMSIWLGEELLSAPYVQEPILNGEAVITGNMTAKEAGELVERIMMGSVGAGNGGSIGIIGGEDGPTAIYRSGGRGALPRWAVLLGSWAGVYLLLGLLL